MTLAGSANSSYGIQEVTLRVSLQYSLLYSEIRHLLVCITSGEIYYEPDTAVCIFSIGQTCGVQESGTETLPDMIYHGLTGGLREYSSKGMPFIKSNMAVLKQDITFVAQFF